MIRFKYSTWLFAGLSLLSASWAMANTDGLPTPIKAIEAQGVKVVSTFAAPSGLQGYAARYNGQGMALYLTSDGKHVLIGTLLDANGVDLSREPLEEHVYKSLGKEMWSRMESSTWIADGHEDAPRIVYMFSDPNCPYCNMFWKQARPWVEAGKVQIRHIMVGMLREDSARKAAALLTADARQAVLNEHMAAGKGSNLKPAGEIPTDIQNQLDENLSLMREMGASATPAIYYMDERGRFQHNRGAPREDALSTILGPLPN